MTTRFLLPQHIELRMKNCTIRHRNAEQSTDSKPTPQSGASILSVQTTLARPLQSARQRTRVLCTRSRNVHDIGAPVSHVPLRATIITFVLWLALCLALCLPPRLSLSAPLMMADAASARLRAKRRRRSRSRRRARGVCEAYSTPCARRSLWP